LSVIEAATGQEDDDDIEEDNLFFHGHSLGSVFYQCFPLPIVFCSIFECDF
jgi:hypothetical protein